jgi:hypothetical protein
MPLGHGDGSSDGGWQWQQLGQQWWQQQQKLRRKK